jgi:hypothetical protein
MTDERHVLPPDTHPMPFEHTLPGSAAALPEQPVRIGVWRSVSAWWYQGLRTLLLKKPDWRHLHTSPAVVACLVLLTSVLSVVSQRIYIKGAANFYGPSLHDNWLATACLAWVCWLLVPSIRPSSSATPALNHGPTAPSMLFTLFMAQFFALLCITAVLFNAMNHISYFSSSSMGRWLIWGLSIAVIVWQLLSQWFLVARSGAPHRSAQWLGAAVVAGTLAITYWLPGSPHWYPDYSKSAQNTDDPESPGLKLTQELLELQPQILQTKLQALGAQKPGKVDLYAITFAPYASENVFQRESQLVASVMQERFGAKDKTIQLINNPSTARDWPWATPLNLRRTIARAAQLMNKDEDVLFIHITSHGARDGQLSAEFWPLEIDTVTPAMLKGWLDEAGVRFRIISISACYSGSWVEPLATPQTLVMTAADATHTSYGCGSKSELTYFGRAMFDEQLRSTTLSFEKAHAGARPVIKKREEEAGKTDGYSNPQIRVGSEIATKLADMEAELGRR